MLLAIEVFTLVEYSKLPLVIAVYHLRYERIAWKNNKIFDSRWSVHCFHVFYFAYTA